MLSRTAGYALNAALYIALNSTPDRPVPATEIARALDIPANYLAKILRGLARTGVLNSERGRNGGFSLALPAREIRLAELAAPFETLGEARQCLLGRGACTDVGGCPAHKEWQRASTPAFRFLEERTLEDLVERTTAADPAA